jgi:soluble lytic murein transglycosylase-like protein
MALDFYLDPADVRAYEADAWAAPHLKALADDWEQQALQKLSAPTSPDPGLAAHLGGATPPPIEQSAGPETAMPVSAPSPPDSLPPAAPALPAPDAPLPTDYGRVPTSPQYFARNTQPAAPTPSASAFGDLVSYARQAAQNAGIDPDLFTRQINQESGFNPNAGSPAGARGIAQIVPRYHPGVDVTDPYASLDYAANLMANLVKQHGGDVRTALVAYNGGEGAVNALNAGTPYAESKQYVERIMSGGAPVPSAAASTAPAGDLSLSQFGDKTLTADEAYAACGPAAAARLASEYGNAIPLSVALQAAKAVGWTPGAGMAGIASEKKLMDALGLPAELDTSGDWGRITSAAGSGSLVTISTPMHYFSANGTRQRPDGQTELYVGQSGLDLKAGKAWMTPAEIEAVAGKVQGALFSDPSRAVMAGDWHQKVINREGLPPPTPDQPLAELATAAQKAGVQRPDETISNPFGEAMRQVGNVAGQVGDALGGAIGKLGVGAGVLAQGQQAQGRGLTQAADATVGAAGAGLNAVGSALPEGSMLRGGMNLSNAQSPAAEGAPVLPAAMESIRTYERGRTAEMQRANEITQRLLSGQATPEEQQWLADYTKSTALAVAGQDVQMVGGMSRFFHGTGSDFGRPDAAKFDPNGLFGPGYYLTDSPVVAGGDVLAAEKVDDLHKLVTGRNWQPGDVYTAGYAQNRAPTPPAAAMDYVAAAEAAFTDAQRQLREAMATEPQSAWTARLRDQVDRMGQHLDTLRASVQTVGPNVRAVDVPQNLNLLNADAPLSVEEAQAISNAIPENARRAFDVHVFVSDEHNIVNTPRVDGEFAYKRLVSAVMPNSGDLQVAKQRAAYVLQQAGYDGIKYNGGQRIPMRDAAGQNIEHTAINVFPQSIDKLRNAISGTQGGQVAPQFATSLGGAAAGGGVTAANTDENDPNRILKIAGGALAGGVAGYGAGRLLGSPARPLAAPSPSGPPTQGSTAYRTLLNMYGDVKTSPLGAIPSQVEEARRTVVRKWTDRGIDLAEFQKDAQRAAGRPLSADEMAYEMRRLNPSGAASMRVQNELKPAIQSVGQDVGPLKVYLTAKDNLDVAAAMKNPDRAFSGGLSAADSQAALDHMAQELGPDRMARVEQAGQQVIDYGRSLLQRKVDAGLISQDLYDELTTKYPNYSPTRIVDYLKDPQGIPNGRKITVQSAGLKSNTVEGTVRQREDPLSSFVRLGYETEALATKNEVAQAFLKLRDLNPDTAMMIRKVADDVPNPRGFEKMKVFENGVPQTYQMPDYIAKAIKEEPVAPVPILGPLMNIFRALATQRNPLFLASNALNDAVSYTIRSSSRLGGPQNIPKVATELVKAYGDAFQGILQAEYHGNTARYMEGGGAMSGFFSHSPEQAQKLANELQLRHVFAVRSDHMLEDVKRLVGQGLLLKPVEAIGERIELAPRVAAMRLAEQAGATQQQAVLAGRTVTLDFSQGGTWAKTLNQYIPFFNTAMQAAATPVRAFSENPRGFIATATSLLAAPTVGFEAWNRSDPQRAKDYADVPQYVKDQGLVFMLPAAPQVDAKGNRKPQYLFFPTREYSPFVTLTREAAGRAMGQEPRDWEDLLLGTGKSVSPISGSSGADVLSSAVPLGVSTSMQLANDQDWFRGGHIVSQTADEQASAFSKAAAAALQKMGIQARPSGVEFAVRDLAAGVGATGLAASDIVAGQPRRDTRVQSTPGVGGLIGRFVQDRTGQQLTNAIAQPVAQNVEKALNDAGIPTPTIPYAISVRSQMTGNQSPPIELRQQERAEYQRLMSERLNERLAPMLADPSWTLRPIASRNKVLEVQVRAARDYAKSRLYAAMAAEDRQARMQAGRLAQQPKPKP